MMRALFVCAAALLVIVPAGCKSNKPNPSPPAGATGAATGTAAPSGDVVATVNGEKITLAELDKSVRPQLIDLERQRGEQEFRIRQQGLDSIIAKKLVDAEAKRRGVNEDQLIKTEVSDKTPPPGPGDEKRFYDENKDRIPGLAGKPFDSVKGDIGQFLHAQLLNQSLQSYVGQLRKNAKVDVNLPPPALPRVQVAAEGPSKGPAGAPVTIVEFSDFQCPYCSKVKPVVDQVVSTYGDKVRLVFRDFPLQIHDKAEKAAEAGQCAQEQGKFWEMYDWMFGHQNQLGPDDLKKAARDLKLDGAKFDQCLDSGRMSAAVQANMKAGDEAGVSSTPTFFVNGQMIAGAASFDTFKRLIDQELAKKS